MLGLKAGLRSLTLRCLWSPTLFYFIYSVHRTDVPAIVFKFFCQGEELNDRVFALHTLGLGFDCQYCRKKKYKACEIIDASALKGNCPALWVFFIPLKKETELPLGEKREDTEYV